MNDNTLRRLFFSAWLLLGLSACLFPGDFPAAVTGDTPEELPPADLSETLDAEGDALDLPPETSDIPPETTDIPPETVDVLPETDDIPPEIADVPPETTDILPDLDPHDTLDCDPPCGPNMNCDGEHCECLDGFTNCDNDDATGCVSFIDNPTHCGACDLACASNATCIDGECRCPPGRFGPMCEPPTCTPACGTHQYCAAPDTCACDEGWAGPACVVSTVGMLRFPTNGDQLVYERGCTENADPTCARSESPRHQVTLDAYFLDAYLVMAADFLDCVQHGPCVYDDPPSSANETYDQSALRDHPINYVNLAQANVYCAWVGKRLPTEAEWEGAAAGPEKRLFPWGDACPKDWDGISGCLEQEWDGNSARANCHEDVCRDGHPATSTVGFFAASASGLFDLAGNVNEWTSSRACDYGPDPVTNPECSEASKPQVMRGGSFGSDWSQLLTYRRQTTFANTRADTLGFRCAVSAGP